MTELDDLDKARLSWSPGDISIVGDVQKSASPVQDKVYQQLLDNYPPKAIAWVKDAEWAGPMNVPFSRIDDDAVKTWAASSQPARVKHFKDKIEAGDHVNPAASVQEPDEDNVKVIDGHHRALAYKELGLPVKTYLGKVSSNGGPWDETHSSQFHQGASPANKGFWVNELRNARGEWESIDIPASRAASEYSKDGMHINNMLRGKETDTDEIKAGYQSVINRMDKSAKPIGSSLTTFRGINGASRMFGTVGSRVGQEFHDDGFISSSKDQDTAKLFQGFGSGPLDAATIKINLKPDDRAIIMKDFLSPGEDAWQEVVLPHGTTFRVVSDESIPVEHLPLGPFDEEPLPDREIVLEVVR